MNRDTAVFAAIILAASLTASPLVPTAIGYGLIVIAYGFVGALIVFRNEISVYIYWPILAPAVVIWGLFAVSFVVNIGRSSLLRLLAFTVFTGITILVVPAVIDRRAAFRALSRVGAILVLIGLPVTLLGTIDFGLFVLKPWALPRQIAGTTYHIPRSIFVTSNQLAALAAFGAIAAIAELVRDRSAIATLLVIVNIVGVVATISRSGMIVLVAGVGLYAAYAALGKTGVTIAAVGGLAAIAAGLVVLLIVAPDTLTGRSALWEATVEAIAHRPVVGWGLGSDGLAIQPWYEGLPAYSGFGTHNSYLRVFLDGGIVAGVAYLVLSVAALVTALRAVPGCRSRPAAIGTVCLVTLLVTYLIRQAFSDPTIFGISILSILGAVFFGYVQPSGSRRSMRVSAIARWLRG